MAREFSKPNVGATGRRRIVPMMGIDFIAGNIENKKGPVRDAYGVKPASMGGRTRKWSFINFLQCNPSGKNIREYTLEEQQMQERFRVSTLSAIATAKDLTVLPRAQADYTNGVVYNYINPNNYATFRGWLTAIRHSQASLGIDITPTYTTWPPVFG